MNRRLFLGGVALAGLAACTSSPVIGPAVGQSGLWPAFAPGAEAVDLETAAAEAWVYGVMLIENAKARTDAMAYVAVNKLFHARELTTVKTQFVTTPNNDTLYSRAWIDLNGGPVQLMMPASGKRYVSYAFMDMYGNNFAVLGTRTTGGEAQLVTLVGPNDESGDPLAVRSPTPWVWLLVRTLIDGEADRGAANALQDGMVLTAPPRPNAKVYATRDAGWAEYFTSVQALLAENPPPVSDLAFFHRIARLGLGPTSGFDASRFSGADAALIASGVAKGKAMVVGRRSGDVRGGWNYPRASLGDFGQDYTYRAQVAVGGLAALTRVEAMYMRPFTPAGEALWPSDKPLLLRFEKDQLPPVNAFWSLTAYVRTPEGAFYFFDNAINRYAIGDRTEGLTYGADGSLEIVIQRNDPGGIRSKNWLPAPPSGPLALTMRTYLPKQVLLDGQYLLPALRPA